MYRLEPPQNNLCFEQKIKEIIHMKITIFKAVKNYSILHRHVIGMIFSVNNGNFVFDISDARNTTISNFPTKMIFSLSTSCTERALSNTYIMY